MAESPSLHSPRPGRTTEEDRVEEEGQNAEEHEVSRPRFLGSCTDGLPDNVLIVAGRRRPLVPDHCGVCIDVMPRFFFSMPAPFTPLCLLALLGGPVLRNPL